MQNFPIENQIKCAKTAKQGIEFWQRREAYLDEEKRRTEFKSGERERKIRET